MIRMTLPGLTEFADINLLFIEVARARPDMFYEDIRIDSVYGGFPGSMLAGGRNNVGERLNIDSVAARIARYNDLGVGCNATFSNQLASPQTLEGSPYDQALLEVLAAGEGNGVILYSDELAEAVRARYPRLAIIASTTKSLTEKAAVDAACGLYDRVVLEYNLTHDEEFISRAAHPEKLEVMVNEYCTLGCPYRDAHYRAVSQAQLRGVEADFPCRHEPAPQAFGFLQGLVEGDVFLKNADIRRYRDEYGVGTFKIVGRGLARYDIVDSYLYYLVRPECWYEFRDFMIHHDFF